MATPFDIFLVSPEREIWSGRATIVVARGTEGEVGILAGHAPMLVELGIAPVFITTEGGERVAAAVDGGFLHVVSEGLETRVDILAEHAELEREIDVEEARREADEAERQLREHVDSRAAARLARARVRLGLRG
jgi:F-type H+-transporting ATPase subunit epsilon